MARTVLDAGATARVVHWNPQRPPVGGRLRRRLSRPRLINNFGDLLGPAIVAREVARRQLTGTMSRRLLAVGSILHFAEDDDVVWGAGVNGKMPDERHQFSRLDVRAVRGPRTREFLRGRGVDAPAVYGDPGLLVPHAFPEVLGWRETTEHPVTVVPNLNEVDSWSGVEGFLDPRTELMTCLRRIAQSELVVGSSLHGIVVAESLGIPARLITPNAESLLKYADYYEGTGRDEPRPAATLAEALRLGGEKPLRWSPEPLLETFPEDLWH